MRPYFHKVPILTQASFSARHDKIPNFGSLWHYHPELELHYTIKGEGVRFIGDNIGNFSNGEIVLLGENLPHTWQCNDKYFEENGCREVEAVVIQFLPNCMGEGFLSLPETHFLQLLYEKAKYGMVFFGETRERVADLMIQSTEAKSFDRVVILLSILKILAESEEYRFITAAYQLYQSDPRDIDRLEEVCTYTLSNYATPITLEQIADIAHLTVTSFCRYFKLMTNKTYYDFLTEIRISHACRFLIADRYSIEQISDRCGFYTTSSFYKQFKKITGMTPLSYKRHYLNLAPCVSL